MIEGHMEWAELDSALPFFIEGLAGIPCDWAGRPRKMHVSARLELDVIAGRGVGIDERRWRNVRVSESGELVGVRARVEGVRELTLQIQAWSPVQPLAKSARRYLDDVRIDLMLPSSLARLRELGLAVVAIEGTVLLDGGEDGRKVSRAALDVRLAHSAGRDDDVVPFIETARVTGEARNAAGELLPPSDINTRER